MSLAIDGLVSGLDTTSLINSLIQLDSVPQTLLKSKVSSTQSMISALQGLNTKVASLSSLMGDTAAPGALDVYSATNSSSGASATVSAGAVAGQIDVVVERLAQAQRIVSDTVSAWPDTNLTITDADGNATPITAASTSLDDVVSAINAAGAGVQAVKVSAGGGLYRLQLGSVETGVAGGFTISGTTVGFTQTDAAVDAEVTMWKGTGAQQTITSATNTFADLMPGVAVTVAEASLDPVTISISRDDAKISAKAGALVSAVNDVLAYISTKTAVTNSTDASGAAKVSGGIFTGDGTARDVQQRILSAASAPVDGRSPSEFGIIITRNGDMKFDPDKFAASLVSDPAATTAAVQEIASRIQAVAEAESDKYDGQITTKITGQQSLVVDLVRQVEDWNGRLAMRRASLERTFSALEVALSKLNSQSSWLTGQLASLPNNTQS